MFKPVLLCLFFSAVVPLSGIQITPLSDEVEIVERILPPPPTSTLYYLTAFKSAETGRIEISGTFYSTANVRFTFALHTESIIHHPIAGIIYQSEQVLTSVTITESAEHEYYFPFSLSVDPSEIFSLNIISKLYFRCSQKRIQFLSVYIGNQDFLSSPTTISVSDDAARSERTLYCYDYKRGEFIANESVAFNGYDEIRKHLNPLAFDFRKLGVLPLRSVYPFMKSRIPQIAEIRIYDPQKLMGPNFRQGSEFVVPLVFVPFDGRFQPVFATRMYVNRKTGIFEPLSASTVETSVLVLPRDIGDSIKTLTVRLVFVDVMYTTNSVVAEFPLTEIQSINNLIDEQSLYIKTSYTGGSGVNAEEVTISYD